MLNSLKAIELLKNVALRPTKQRIALTKILFQENHWHVTAEQLHSEAIRKGYKISLATVYNALNSFKEAGIVKQVLVEPGKIYFDTNTESHHHFYIEETGELVDVPDDECKIVSLPLIPAEYTVNQVEITIRLEKTKEANPRSRN